MNARRYLVYHLRWQASTLVMLAPMYLLNEVVGLAGTTALPFVQLVGACIFWYVDSLIFTSDLLDDTDDTT